MRGFAMQNAGRPAAAQSRSALPVFVPAAERGAYRALFASIRAGDFAAAAEQLSRVPAGPVADVATAELMLAPGAPASDPTAILALIGRAPSLPQTAELAKLVRAAGITSLPWYPLPRDLVSQVGRAPRRGLARSVAGDSLAVSLGEQIRPLIRDDRPAEAEMLLASAELNLSPEARTEWQQRVAWSYYLTGDTAAARRLAGVARQGAGDWAVHADWVAGLAAWRDADCAAAADAFDAVSRRAADTEMMAAGLFWGARAAMACKRPDTVQAKLRTASRLEETFYGLIAREALGIAPARATERPDFIQADLTTIAKRPNVQTALALAELGELGLADALLRHQARIGDASDHAAVLRVAARIGLPATQVWLAHNAPRGSTPEMAARYPAPAWQPDGGWRVDRSLVFAHALQESAFRTDAVSRAGARGLMQVLPSTADLLLRKSAIAAPGDLSNPDFNIACGQAYLEQLRDATSTGGLLPKVIAAYNAGPGAIAKWIGRLPEHDPLLYIESIPYIETRAYVALVLRNYWMYQANAGVHSPSLAAMAQNLWPRFPGMKGATAVRFTKATGYANVDEDIAY